MSFQEAIKSEVSQLFVTCTKRMGGTEERREQKTNEKSNEEGQIDAERKCCLTLMSVRERRRTRRGKRREKRGE